ncbi:MULTISPECIES: MFS transporter [unclassified Undibacterium]|uniref:MFS transporter n=1 Tax=unclassified Undibacterium TaxID=2630295 RepID=UPI002AC8ED69|nr:MULTISPECIES: MFS transporter [unclassified Undibacterium]MEB0139544.1 MFS transporter [Undibacterium sp. CCC2.1]MEB0172525.1 MFS transporter [Undibacterium sp. CCC1.1]MEB0178146.1 MFS transporter [Undibacterium sp. CCC3.4]MEB0215603.1 MFS transporter [Undibacterium sp. 5I2]WPX43998.1 MFS transporter [Undibacterium sp. CCC3.4]
MVAWKVDTSIVEKLDSKIMIPLFAIVAVDAIGAGVILPLLPFYALHFGCTPIVLGILVASFALSQFIAAPWIGQLSDQHGRKPILLVSQCGTFLSLILLACANNLWLLFIARIIDGITSGNISVAAALAIDHSTQRTRKQAIGVISAAIGVGMVIGPSLSSVLVRYSITAPIWGAACLSALSFFTTWLMLNKNTSRPSNVTVTKAEISIWKFRDIAGLPQVLAILAAFYLVMAMYISQAALFLSSRFSFHSQPFGPKEIGIVFACSGAINIFVQLVAIKKIGRIINDKMISVWGFVFLGSGFIILGTAQTLVTLATSIILISLGGSVIRPTLTAALTNLVPRSQQGAIMGLNTSIMAMFNVLGPLIAGVAINRGWYAGWAYSLFAISACATLFMVGFIINRVWPLATQ